MGDIDAFVAIKPQCHFTERISSNSGNETDVRSQTGAGHGLVGTFSAIVHAISRSQKRFAGIRHTLDFHGETGGVTAHDGDPRSGQEDSPERVCPNLKLVSLPQRGNGSAV